MMKDSSGHDSLRKLVRHDLRGPLGVIAGHCELLQEGVVGELTERQLRSIAAISRQVTRLDLMLDQLAAQVVPDDSAPTPDPSSPAGRDR